MRLVRSAFLALVAVLALAAPAAAAPARVPFGFVGTQIDGPLTEPFFSLEREMPLIVGAGNESVRFVIYWSYSQPYRRFEDVPADRRAEFRDEGGIPTSWADSDKVVRAAARRRLKILPVVTEAPAWAAKRPGLVASPPSNVRAYVAYLEAVMDRYGPGGSFWRENPGLPRVTIRDWQVWNEPNLRTSWVDRTWAPGYVSLLRPASAAIRRKDKRARVVLAGLPNQSWRDLRQIYRRRGARRLFDVVAIHPYTAKPPGLVTILRLVRGTMRRYGDRRKPMLVTEFGFPSSRGKTQIYGFETTEAGQARRLRQALPLLAKYRKQLRLRAIFHNTWIGREQRGVFTFRFSGLRRFDLAGAVVSKPALAAFRSAALRLERCRRKGAVATSCLRKR